MRGVSYGRFGGSDVLERGDLPEPTRSQNAVIVRMKAAAMSPADIQPSARF
jgi:NADPH:quinone reductase-like Zn-dependent oxidoreductase